jgi:hypothetical protein
MIEDRQLQLLRALAIREAQLREEGRPTDFSFLQMPGPAFGFKPGIANEQEIGAMEGDLKELEAEGFVRLSRGSSDSVVCKLALTTTGRAASRKEPLPTELDSGSRGAVPPSADSILSWLRQVSETPDRTSALRNGGALLNDAVSVFQEDQLGAVAGRILDLGDAGLLLFDDPAAAIEGPSDIDRLRVAANFRLSPAGLDRVSPSDRPTIQNIGQIITATQAQVAGRDINNFHSYDQLVAQLTDALDQLQNVDEEAREEARGILAKLKSASSSVASGAASSGGGALLGTLLKEALGLE